MTLYNSFMTPWIAARQASLSFTISWSLLKLMSVESMMAPNHLILITRFSSCPQSFPASGSFPTSFSSSHQVAKALELHISPSNEYSGSIFFRVDWLDLQAVQETLKNLLQHHSSKASILRVLSILYGPTLTSIHDHWKNHSLD